MNYSFGSNKSNLLYVESTSNNIDKPTPMINEINKPIRGILSGHKQTICVISNEEIVYQKDSKFETHALGQIVNFSNGNSHYVFLVEPNRIYVYGKNYFGGDPNIHVYEEITELLNFKVNRRNNRLLKTGGGNSNTEIVRVVCGSECTYYLTSNGKLYCCGNSENSVLANYTKGIAYTPYKILDDVKKVWSGSCSYSSFALTYDNKLYAWGHNYQAELGFLSIKNVTKPQQIKFFDHFYIKKITIGLAHTVVLASTNSNDFSQVEEEMEEKEEKEEKEKEKVKEKEENEKEKEKEKELEKEKDFEKTKLQEQKKGTDLSKEINVLFSCGRFGYTGNKKLKIGFQQIEKSEKLQIAKIKAGMYHTLILTKSNQLYVFGGNGDAQLGLGHKKRMVNMTLIEQELIPNGIRVGINCGPFSSFIFRKMKKIDRYTKDFLKLYRRKEGTDLIIGGKFQVHSVWVQLRTRMPPEKVKQILEQKIEKSQEKEILFKKIEDWLIWIYSGYVQNTENIKEISSILGLKFKKMHLKHFLKQVISSNQQAGTDFIIKCEKGKHQVKVHRMVLQARSGLYRKFFLSIQNKNTPYVSDFTGKKLKTIMALIHFLYTDFIPKKFLSKSVKRELGDSVQFYQISPKIEKILLGKIRQIDELEKNYQNNFGINQFSDLTEEEFGSRYLTNFIKYPDQNEHSNTNDLEELIALPNEVDNRNTHFTHIKDQGACGSCWAFCTISLIESTLFQQNNILVELSEEQILDCCYRDPGDGYIPVYQSWVSGGWNDGCDGGNLVDSLQFNRDFLGAVSSEEYPYTGFDGSCNTGFTKLAQISTNDPLTPLRYATVEQIKKTIYNYGVAVVYVNADGWGGYESGVFKSTRCFGTLNHAVVLAGYGYFNHEKMWIVRNSWGDRWGNNGYMYLARGVSDFGGKYWPNGMCKVRTEINFLRKPLTTSLNKMEDISTFQCKYVSTASFTCKWGVTSNESNYVLYFYHDDPESITEKHVECPVSGTCSVNIPVSKANGVSVAVRNFFKAKGFLQYGQMTEWVRVIEDEEDDESENDTNGSSDNDEDSTESEDESDDTDDDNDSDQDTDSNDEESDSTESENDTSESDDTDSDNDEGDSDEYDDTDDDTDSDDESDDESENDTNESDDTDSDNDSDSDEGDGTNDNTDSDDESNGDTNDSDDNDHDSEEDESDDDEGDDTDDDNDSDQDTDSDDTDNSEESEDDSDESGENDQDVQPPPIYEKGCLYDQKIDINLLLRYTFEKFCFSSPYNLTYSSTLANDTDLPAWISFHSKNRTFLATPPASSLGKKYLIKLIAFDPLYKSGHGNFSIVVSNSDINKPVFLLVYLLVMILLYPNRFRII
ncbi:cathepsin l [Anaeramoeba flamelloides]|uniref:Cathepsin l n=1 Tax=Anaeramoeba flamelloides TaxID=1746091 RepID=A0AAV7ZPS4_9EUKA|nr:cathepsin l [Anaeramoeba flamelloides]